MRSGIGGTSVSLEILANLQISFTLTKLQSLGVWNLNLYYKLLQLHPSKKKVLTPQY